MNSFYSTYTILHFFMNISDFGHPRYELFLLNQSFRIQCLQFIFNFYQLLSQWLSLILARARNLTTRCLQGSNLFFYFLTFLLLFPVQIKLSIRLLRNSRTCTLFLNRSPQFSQRLFTLCCACVIVIFCS